MVSRAAELDPVSQAIMKDKGLAFYYGRQYQDALEMGRKTLELDPNYAAAHRLLSLAYSGQDLFDEAIAANQNWGNLTGNKIETSLALAQIYSVSGQTEAARELVEVVKQDPHLIDQAYRGMALVYAALGENDAAFGWLEKGYQRREESLLSLKADPKVDRLRSDPRFTTLLKRIGVEK